MIKQHKIPNVRGESAGGAGRIQGILEKNLLLLRVFFTEGLEDPWSNPKNLFCLYLSPQFGWLMPKCGQGCQRNSGFKSCLYHSLWAGAGGFTEAFAVKNCSETNRKSAIKPHF